MKQLASLIGPLLVIASCTDYTPKPYGYVRIEPQEAVYKPFVSDSLPYAFNLSQQATINWSMFTDSTKWINIEYPDLKATIYCSHQAITPATLPIIENENRQLIYQLLSPYVRLKEKAYSYPEEKMYGSLFLLEGETSSPIHFVLTDSSSILFRGALYYNCKPNADSLAPVTNYLQHDIIELIQSFHWK